MLGIPVGLAVANVTEWLVHKHWLHGLGKRRGSFFSFHWHDHHNTVRRNQHYDSRYETAAFDWSDQVDREAALLLGAAALHVPLLPIAPFYVGTMWYSAWNYYRVHKRSHLDPAWARTHLPWHYDHHMGPDQDANWCVTHPWFDQVMGTRKPYAGTEREARDLARQAKRQARKASAAA